MYPTMYGPAPGSPAFVLLPNGDDALMRDNLVSLCGIRPRHVIRCGEGGAGGGGAPPVVTCDAL